jgi:carbon-monoxide dehydrogenase small subunit
MKIHLSVNDRQLEIETNGMKRLLDVLREDLHLTGTKEGCGEGECGACSVIVNGQVINSCLVPVCQMQQATITTIEGIANNGQLDPLQQAFLVFGGAQCGICTPGMLIAARVLLDSNSHPTIDEIRESIAGNLCRCTGYTKIIDAIEHTANLNSD